jgi:hypothetical protein
MPPTTVVAPGDVAVRAPHFRYLEWGPIIAGALGAAAISFVLFAFGAALGLSSVSPYPYRGLSASTFFIVAALYMAMVQVVSYAAGGYLAGRMRTPWLDGVVAERHFRDGAHGFAVWAISLIVSGGLLASGAGGVLKTATEAASVVTAGTGAAAVNRLSMEPSDYATDYLLRPGPAAPAVAAAPAATPAAPATMPTDGTAATPAPMPAAPAMQAAAPKPLMDRAPISRLFVSSLKNGSLAAPDRAYLVQVVSQETGVSQAEAEKRVDQAYVQAKDAEQKARDLANEARKKAALAGFLTAATLALACATACVAAGMGGKDRDEETAHTYWFGATRFW